MRTGRPPLLNEDLQEDLCNYLRTGCYLETAAAMCGIDKATLHEWSKRGAREKRRREKLEDELVREKEADKERVRKIRTEERERRAKRQKADKKARKREQRYVDFHDALQKAMAQAELADLAVIANAARGGHVIETRTMSDGTVIEKRAKPEWQAAAWRRERRSPERWAQVKRLEVSGTEGGAPIALTMADAVKLAHAKKIEREKKNGTNGVNHALGANSNGTQEDGAQEQ